MIRVIVSGVVMKVRDSSFVDTRTKEQISMLYIDVFDATAGLQNLSCKLSAAAFRPEVKQEIMADVIGLRPTKFGSGINVSIGNLRLANGAGVKPAPPVGK